MNRVITGLLLALAASYIVFLSPPLIFKLAALYVGGTCYWEYSGIAAHHGIRRPLLFGFLAGALFILAAPYSPLGLSLLAIAALIAALLEDNLREILPHISAEFFGAIYTFLPWHFAELLRLRSIHWLFFALALNWFGDSVAYYTGRAFGKHRLAPVISPKKSWEGAMGAVVGSVVFGVIYMGYFQPQTSPWKVALIAVIANVAGQTGDLAESAMKRGAGVKDSGSILPGHGGLLDRVDSSLFAIPVVYACSLLVS
jgi:phosphatidate cytidylyltransferase